MKRTTHYGLWCVSRTLQKSQPLRVRRTKSGTRSVPDTLESQNGKGGGHHLCAAPSGPFRQMVPVRFSPCGANASGQAGGEKPAQASSRRVAERQRGTRFSRLNSLPNGRILGPRSTGTPIAQLPGHCFAGASVALAWLALPAVGRALGWPPQIFHGRWVQDRVRRHVGVRPGLGISGQKALGNACSFGR